MQPQRVLVTGGHGFLGFCVLERLRALPWAGEILSPRRSECDLRDPGAVDALLKRTSPTLVIHLAASMGGIGANMRLPADFLHDNAVMGLCLLRAAKDHGVGKVVNVGTVCSYPKITPVPFREEDLWNGYPEETNAPFGLAKKLLIVAAEAYRKQYGLHAVTLVLTNLYGPRDTFDPERSHVIPAIIRKCVEAVRGGTETVTLWGDGSATRDFLFVEDAAEAIVLACEKYDDPAPVNIGTGIETSIRDLARLIAELTGFQGNFRWQTEMPGGQPRRCLDGTRARLLLGFLPQILLREGLQRTIDWYRSIQYAPRRSSAGSSKPVPQNRSTYSVQSTTKSTGAISSGKPFLRNRSNPRAR